MVISSVNCLDYKMSEKSEKCSRWCRLITCCVTPTVQKTTDMLTSQRNIRIKEATPNISADWRMISIFVRKMTLLKPLLVCSTRITAGVLENTVTFNFNKRLQCLVPSSRTNYCDEYILNIIYSHGQKFTTTKEHVSLQFQWFLQLSCFCDQWVEHKLLCLKNIHEVWFSNWFIIGLLKMWPNLLDQNYTCSNSSFWLNVSWPFSPQSGAFNSHPQASGRPLAEVLTTPLDRVSEGYLQSSAFWHRLVSSAQSTCSRWGLSQNFGKCLLLSLMGVSNKSY